MKTIQLPKLFSQWDSRWSQFILGYNQPGSIYTIYNFGCLITCITKVLNYTSYNETPDSVNQKLKDNAGFAPGTGYYNWGTIPKLYSKVLNERIVYTPDLLTDGQMMEIRNSLDKGYPVMLQIDYNPATVAMDMHYVLAIGYNPSDENDILIADPLGGKEHSLKDYLKLFKPSARRTITQYIIYECKVTEAPKLKDMIIDFDDPEKKRHTVGWYVYEWYNEKVNGLKKSVDYEAKISKNAELLKQSLDRNIELANEISRKETMVKDALDKNAQQKLQIDRLVAENATLYKPTDLILMLLSKFKIG